MFHQFILSYRNFILLLSVFEFLQVQVENPKDSMRESRGIHVSGRKLPRYKRHVTTTCVTWHDPWQDDGLQAIENGTTSGTTQAPVSADTAGVSLPEPRREELEQPVVQHGRPCHLARAVSACLNLKEKNWKNQWWNTTTRVSWYRPCHSWHWSYQLTRAVSADMGRVGPGVNCFSFCVFLKSWAKMAF